MEIIYATCCISALVIFAAYLIIKSVMLDQESEKDWENFQKELFGE